MQGTGFSSFLGSQCSVMQRNRFGTESIVIGVFMTRMGHWGMLWYTHRKEPTRRKSIQRPSRCGRVGPLGDV